MGLTRAAVGHGATAEARQKAAGVFRSIALAGNPNVGKSTLFNALTGEHQHTGNWPGKTVASARGYCSSDAHDYELVDLPGTYSLLANSPEEEIARDYLCSGEAEAAAVVCDATCLERNLNLVLQVLEMCPKTLVCVNLMDEAKRKGITVNLEQLSALLGVPVIATSAADKASPARLLHALDRLIDGEDIPNAVEVRYPDVIEEAIDLLEPMLAQEEIQINASNRWLALRMLQGDLSKLPHVSDVLLWTLERAQSRLSEQDISQEQLEDMIVCALVRRGEEIGRAVVRRVKTNGDAFDRRLDKLLTSRATGYPVMLALLAFVFWLTISGSNYPSDLLSAGLFWIQDRLTDLFHYLGAPEWLHGILVLGAYRTLAWVTAVMLPPMAIFFPLFTLLEDVGYLPRVAYNLDRPFQRCDACGKQALTMCMGFGCNAAGVVGCRIIDSPRERMLAILTNNFAPCNGRFPTLINILTIFFVGTAGGLGASVASAALLTVVVVMGIGATFGATKLLSVTLLKGMPSYFTLELPPYRKPQIGKVIVRSVLDRTIFVLGRAVAIAAPAGILLYVLANINVGNASMLAHCAAFLDPFARLLGLDGVILIAFILGCMANETVIPIMMMAYLAQGSLTEMSSLAELQSLFAANGWTWVTAVCVVIFTVMHWPCSTTLLTVKKESGSWKWTALAAAVPTLCGMVTCAIVNAVATVLFF